MLDAAYPTNPVGTDGSAIWQVITQWDQGDRVHRRGFAFDYNGSAKQDHLVLYRHGTGTIWILR